ncbi:MAG TPA: hypothetical protein VFA41_07650 [Ktedonobacteraceae bacterium]|nr:hypothetical protein [Ktedonobacteraceae bacterium]
MGLESVTQVPTTATNSPAIPGVPTAGTSEVTQVPPTSTNPPTHFTQSGPINLSPDSANYSYTISSWSKPAYNNYCQLATCDPTSERKDLLREGRVVTATCWTYGQRVITGTLDNPGYDDNRWVRLEDGTYLANTWFVRTNLLTSQLPTC